MQHKLVRQATASVVVALLIVVLPSMIFAVGWWRRLGGCAGGEVAGGAGDACWARAGSVPMPDASQA